MKKTLLSFVGALLCSGVCSPLLQGDSVAHAHSAASIHSKKLHSSHKVRPTHTKKRLSTSALHKKYAYLNPVLRKAYVLRTALERRQIHVVTKAAALEPKIAAPKPYEHPAVNHDDIAQKHKDIANDVLSKLPQRCSKVLENFYVRYDNPQHRGLAGKTTMILSGNVSDQEFRALMVHELGHVFDLNENTDCLGGNAHTGITEFRDGKQPMYEDDPSVSFYRISWASPKEKKAGTKPTDFVSGYAGFDVYEDFAESFVYFVLQNEDFARRAQDNPVLAAKYRWMQQHMFPQGVSLANGHFYYNGRVPWDVTKLGYTWKTNVRVASRN